MGDAQLKTLVTQPLHKLAKATAFAKENNLTAIYWATSKLLSAKGVWAHTPDRPALQPAQFKIDQ